MPPGSVPPNEPAAREPSRAVRPYRRTMLDRYGPDFARVLTAVGWSSLGAVMLLPVGLYYGPRGWPVPLAMAVYYVVGLVVMTTVAVQLPRPASAVAEFYLAPTGASTPYEEQFSQEQALVMQGRVREALASFEARIAADATGIAVRIRAADLYAGPGGDPARAAQLFREAQRLPDLRSGDDVYVGNRLADLYLGPLQQPARALVELRRLLDRYPDSRIAPQLRQAIASLKARHVSDERPR
ncbi:MAG: hypothetical protein KGL93_05500 [Gemmatimonadota bacterium]|nr:hypothetical protein [Gemmatimonadota bacterium]